MAIVLYYVHFGFKRKETVYPRRRSVWSKGEHLNK